MMAPPRYANQRDTNEPDMIAVARQIGATWLPLNVKDGPDGVLGFRGINFLVEFKHPPGPRGGTSHSKQSPGQVKFEITWRGQYAVICDEDGLLELISSVIPPIYSKGCR